MASIGGVSCTMVKGQSRGPNKRTVTWRVPGLNGFGSQDLGASDSDFSFIGIKYDTGANVETWKAAIEALQGTVISVIDDYAVTHTYLLLMQVGSLRKQTIIYEGNDWVRGEIQISGVKIA